MLRSLRFSLTGLPATMASGLVVLACVGCGSSTDAGAFKDPSADGGPTTDADGADGATDGGPGVDGATDTASDVCAPGKTENGGCGKCGTHLRVCNANATWSEWSACANENGVCAPGEADQQTCTDGGKKTRVCTASCTWGTFSACTGGTVCTSGQSDEEACGNCGKRLRVCSASGTWSDWSSCNGEGVCAAGSKDEQVCGLAGKKTRTCLTSCTWTDFSACVGDVTPCTSGSTEKSVCGNCGESVRVCGSDLTWSDWSTCNNQGTCTIGAKENESCTAGGQRTRSCTDACAWGTWSACPNPGEPTELWAAKGAQPGTTTSTAMALTIERIRLSDRAVVGTIALPIAAAGANKPLTVRSDHLGEGHLLRSQDGHYVTLAGYAAAPGTATPGSTSSTTIPRVIGRINAAGTVDTSTTTTSFSAGAVRGAVTADGSSFYAFGPQNFGLVRVTYGGTGAGTTINTDETGIADFVNGQLWYTRVATSGGTLLSYSPPPTTSSAGTMVLPSDTFSGADPWAFVAFSTTGTPLAGADRVYIADASVEGIQVWVKSTTWTKLKTVTVGSGYETLWLTGFQRGTDFVMFATARATASGATATKVVTFVDPTAATLPAVTTVKTGTATSQYLGVAFAPQ